MHCQNLYYDLCLIDPSIINFGEESLLNALLYGSYSVLRNKFSRFNIPYIMPSKAQPHTMTYISCHPEVFYKKVFLKFLQNSKEKSCPGVYFSCIYNKKGSGTAGLLWIFRNWFNVKIQKANVGKYFLKKCIYFLCIYKSNLLWKKNLLTVNAAVVFKCD